MKHNLTKTLLVLSISLSFLFIGCDSVSASSPESPISPTTSSTDTELSSSAAASSPQVTVSVDYDNPTAPLGDELYGIFFEDINFAADGGLYAELVQNRSFEYYSIPGGNPLSEGYNPLTSWEKIEHGQAKCSLTVDKIVSLNRNNPNYLVINISDAGDGVGVSNSGFDGICLNSGDKYDISFFARSEGRSRPHSITASLILPDGTICGSAEFSDIAEDWKKFEAVLTSDSTTDNAKLALTTNETGTLFLDMVSLFPQKTFKGRKNGMRADLAQSLADLRPKFFRFPGGCITHGQGLQNAYRWKDSVGPVEQRRPNWNRWGYHQTYGLGYYEYFLLCEDIGAEPLPVVPIGVSCGFTAPYQVCAMDDLQEWIDDAVDLIEFANGSVDTKWGSLRAKMGHPESFDLKYICLGNEEHDRPEMRERFPYFVEAVRKKFPDVKILGTSGLGTEIPLYDLMNDLKVYGSDEHYYMSPQWYLDNTDRFDNFDRSKPKIFIGEYASEGNTLFNAVAEAAFLTGVERNGDIVELTCYAPLFSHYDHSQWPRADLIWFDNRNVVKTPNYYVQQLFTRNQGNVYLHNTVTRNENEILPTIQGGVGIGTWATAIECDSPTVNETVLNTATWNVQSGTFETVEDIYAQTDSSKEPAISIAPVQFTDDTVTYTVFARKTAGAEGFLVIFGAKDDQNYYWFNVGGWNNSQHAIESMIDGHKSVLVQSRGSINDNTWYTAKVELSPGRIRCYLDDELIFDYEMKKPSISVASTLDKSAGEIIVKLVNPTDDDIDTLVSLNGVDSVAPTGKLLLIDGKPSAINDRQNPTNVCTQTSDIKVGTEFAYTMPAMSVQFIRVKVK